MNQPTARPHLDPAKRYYRVREVSAIVGVPAYVLRFWEREFSGLRPRRTASGHRLYRHADVVLLGRIRHLLHERGFTIAGARRQLADRTGGDDPPDAAAVLAEVRRELEDLRRMLSISNEKES